MELRPLTLADLEAATEVQSAAFQDDPLWVYLYPDVERRKRLLRKTFVRALRLGILSEQAYGIGEPLEGLALWSAPNDSTPIAAVLRSGLWQMLFVPAFMASLPRAIPIFSRFESMQKRYAPEPHYYLQTISVAPRAQGKGLASRLIRPFLMKADAERVSVYTETMTPSNVGLYEHYGFRTVEQYDVPGQDLHVWGFYRPVQ
ncbi:MAG: GNAT family N-acetyltransferase [Anaerolineae bacterium]|nr:GNAT family N-acetyltransferase [Anaerolineae bacterium]